MHLFVGDMDSSAASRKASIDQREEESPHRGWKKGAKED